MAREVIPAVSIVIPMYNAEKYIGECLDSILAQTFQDYEVIVVDDCSADKSCEIVESYAPKFDGKLELIRSEKNSGDGGLPRNIGLKHSRGEFIYFVDNDDAITETALEELHQLTLDFQADVFYFEKYYKAAGETVTTDKTQLEEKIMKDVKPTPEPTFLPMNLYDRVYNFCTNKVSWAPWSYFVRRKLLIDNKIEFPSKTSLEDAFFALSLICLAERILIAPNVIYIWRYRHDSLTKVFAPPLEMMIRRTESIFKLIKVLDEFMSRVNFFTEFPEFRYRVFEMFTRHNIDEGKVKDFFAKNPVYELDELIRREIDVGDNAALITFLFCRMNVLDYNLDFVFKELIENLNNRIRRQTTLIEQQTSQIEKLQDRIQQLQTQLQQN